MDQNQHQHQPGEDFVRLLSMAQRPVFLCAMGIVHNAADAEEVLQETNLVLWRKFHQFEPGTDFIRWARKIARLESSRFLRSRSRVPAFSSEFLEAIAEADDDAFDMWEPRREALDACLRKMSAKDAHLLELRYARNLTATAAARVLGRSERGTRQSLQRIRETLLSCVSRAIAAEDHP